MQAVCRFCGDDRSPERPAKGGESNPSIRLRRAQGSTMSLSNGRRGGQAGSYRCPRCKKEDQKYKAQRKKLRRSLPFYLKADI